MIGHTVKMSSRRVAVMAAAAVAAAETVARGSSSVGGSVTGSSGDSGPWRMEVVMAGEGVLVWIRYGDIGGGSACDYCFGSE